MTQAIAYLHRLDKPIVHRNLRARNVLFITSSKDPNFPDVRVAGFEFAIQGDDPSFDAGVTAKACLKVAISRLNIRTIIQRVMVGRSAHEKLDA